jgi:hypothetical protein
LKEAEEPPISREDLLRVGGRLLIRAMRQVENRYITQSNKQSWARIVSSLIANLGGVLKDWEIQEIEDRLTRLEELNKIGEKA